MSILGPQWLCDCNASEEHISLDHATQGAGRHFLEHTEQENYREGAVTVTVYRKRGDWASTISTQEQAEKAVHTWRSVANALTTTALGDSLRALGDAARAAASQPIPAEIPPLPKINRLPGDSISAEQYNTLYAQEVDFRQAQAEMSQYLMQSLITPPATIRKNNLYGTFPTLGL